MSTTTYQSLPLTKRKFNTVALTSSMVLASILLLALAARLFRLQSMFPILVDESIYLRWAEIIQHQHQWFISLLDGKQPLSFWILAAVRLVWPSDPLLGGRLLSVAAGLASTTGLYLLGRKLSGELAGWIAALLYAVMPYSVFYDRIAYTDALVNCFGIFIVYASIVHFDSLDTTWRSMTATAFLLGAGFFTKSTVALFAFVPALACLLFCRRRWRSLLLIYGIAALFPLISLLCVPNAPTFSTSSVIFHRDQFFTPLKVLLADPLFNLRYNLPLLWGYLHSYVTIPLLLLIPIALTRLLRARSRALILLISVCVFPLAFQTAVLEYFPSRYPFAHIWPCLVIVALAAADFIERFASRSLRFWGPALLALPLAVQSARLVMSPDRYLFPDDVDQFQDSNPYVGWGVREAIDYLQVESRNGPFVLLTDPYWGPPADAMFPYLNLRFGIRVHEAWWMEISDDVPILPQHEMLLMRSHYERVKGDQLDFSTVPRVFYVTDTGYFSAAAVHKREPRARLVASFKKPNGTDSVDVYQLK